MVKQAYLESQTKRRKGDIKSRSQGSAIRKKTLEDLTIVSLSVGVFLSFLIFVVQQQETPFFYFSNFDEGEVVKSSDLMKQI